MSKAYTKDFLVGAYMFRFCEHNLDTLEQEKNASKHYDAVGKDQFRAAASLDPSELKRYQNFCLDSGIDF